MNSILMTVNYLRTHARRVGRVAFGGEAGALTLEWLLIAVAIAIAAGAAAAVFSGLVTKEDAKLP
jgi:hypothetical protein